MFIKKCAICGREFETGKGNRIYCSDDCAIEGRKAKRNEWMQRTGYYEKHRHAMELYNAKISEEEYQKRIQEEKKKRASIKRRQQYDANKRRRELEEQANNGDQLARMWIARCDNPDLRTNFDYWNAYKLYSIDFYESWGKKSPRCVNGVSVYDEDFEIKVMECLTESGRIYSSAC